MMGYLPDAGQWYRGGRPTGEERVVALKAHSSEHLLWGGWAGVPRRAVTSFHHRNCPFLDEETFGISAPGPTDSGW